MEKQWLPYNSLGQDLESDMEKIMIYNSPGQGVSIEDIYRYLADISFIYANLYAKIVLKSKNKLDADQVYTEIYNQNDGFLAGLKKTMMDKKFITVREAEKIISQFKVPNIDWIKSSNNVVFMQIVRTFLYLYRKLVEYVITKKFWS